MNNDLDKFLADNMLTADDYDVSSFLMEENVHCQKRKSSSSQLNDMDYHYKYAYLNNETPSIEFDCKTNPLEIMESNYTYSNICNNHNENPQLDVKIDTFSPRPIPSPSESTSSGYSSNEWTDEIGDYRNSVQEVDPILSTHINPRNVERSSSPNNRRARKVSHYSSPISTLPPSCPKTVNTKTKKKTLSTSSGSTSNKPPVFLHPEALKRDSKSNIQSLPISSLITHSVMEVNNGCIRNSLDDPRAPCLTSFNPLNVKCKSSPNDTPAKMSYPSVPISTSPSPSTRLGNSKSENSTSQLSTESTTKNCMPSLFLTPEAFIELTKGVNFNIQPLTVPPVSAQKLQPFSTTGNNIPIDEKVSKRQQRMIKNRESAYLSRKKKTDYIHNLEHELKELRNENEQLKSERTFLKSKICTLELEVKTFKKILSSKDLKKNTCLMVMIFMVALNLAPFGLISSSNDHMKISPPKGTKSGRTLLWENNNKGSISELPITFEEKFLSDTLVILPSQFKNSSVCPTFVNKSESVRLEKELRVWALRVENQKKERKAKWPLAPLKLLRKHLMIPMTKLKHLVRSKKEENNDWSKGSRNGLELYSGPHLMYQDLFKALQRQDDTFYFVSFSGDHLLLPATAHNRTQRPKMSLIMPAMTFNETTKGDQITMMQIDCEVMNTKLVQVKESVIPTHMRNRAKQDPLRELKNNSSTHFGSIYNEHRLNNRKGMKAKNEFYT